MLRLQDEIKKIEPSLCTIKQVGQAFGIVEVGISGLLKDLEWLHEANFYASKWHTRAKIREITSLYKTMLEDIPGQLVSFAELLYWCHDIGRLVEGCSLIANHVVAVPIKYENHGRAAVYILYRLGVLMIFDGLAQDVISYAISHHHDRVLPPLRKDAGRDEKTKDFFARVVRDWDMLGGLTRKTEDWLNSAEMKATEMRQYNILGEKNAIIPRDLVDNFANFRPVDTSQISSGRGSWEAYQLCHLAWIFNISFVETIEILANSGVIGDYLDYFERQLPAEQYEVIEQTINRYFNQQGVAYSRR